MDVLDSMIRNGCSFPRSVELSAQWCKILAMGPLFPVTMDDFHAVEGSGLGDFHRVVRWYPAGMRLFGGGATG